MLSLPLSALRSVSLVACLTDHLFDFPDTIRCPPPFSHCNDDSASSAGLHRLVRLCLDRCIASSVQQHTDFDCTARRYTRRAGLVLLRHIVRHRIISAPMSATSTQTTLCYGMTVWIFGFSTMRDYLFHHTLQTQQPHPGLHAIAALTHPLAYGLYAVGSTLVLSSFYALGLTGTFLGDYVGILMHELVARCCCVPAVCLSVLLCCIVQEVCGLQWRMRTRRRRSGARLVLLWWSCGHCSWGTLCRPC